MTEYQSPIHFRPKEGVLADTIPFFRNGEYHIFYLRGSIGIDESHLEVARQISAAALNP